MIREWLSALNSVVFGREKTEPRDTVFSGMLKEMGEKAVKDAMREFKESRAYPILREYFVQAQRSAQERLMTCDPQDSTTIAYCQTYSSLVLLFDGIVDNLSSTTLDQEMREHLPKAKELI